MAEFERALMQERVRAGLRNAQAKGKKLGRSRVEVDAAMMAALRAQGRSWAEIVNETRSKVRVRFSGRLQLCPKQARDTLNKHSF